MIQKILLISMCCLGCFSCVHSTKKESIISDKAPAPIGPYSQAIKAGESVYVSGQIALNNKGVLDTSDIQAETKQVMENIRFILEASGKQMTDVVKATIYLTNLQDFSEVNSIYSRYFPEKSPARETVQVSGLPKGAHLEISVIAK